MSFPFPTITRRTTKARRCWICTGQVEAGELCVAQASIDGGSISTAYAHRCCRALIEVEPEIVEGDEPIHADAIREHLDYWYNADEARYVLHQVKDPELREQLLTRYADLLAQLEERP